MKIGITGCAGFIGSHLVDALLSREHTVIGLDNLSMGRLENIAHNMKNPQFSFTQADVRDFKTMDELFKHADALVHLAAYKIPRYGNAIDTLLINNQGAHNILEIARKRKNKVVLASTSDVYGKNHRIPFNEEDDCVLGASTVSRWSYAVSKLFDEHLALAYQEEYNIPVVLLRFFGSYGPRHHLSWWGGPQSVFIDQVLKNEEITIHGDGEQTRSFTFISDTVSGIVRSVEKDAANGEIFNIGSTYEISILELANLIHKLSGVEHELNLSFIPYQSFSGKKYEDVLRRIPDIGKAQTLLGFKPKISLEQGMLETIRWQRCMMGNELHKIIDAGKVAMAI